MPQIAPPGGLEANDYEAIEAAVMETARGRWFLLEHARRTRAAEADRMIAAIGRLSEVVRQQRLAADRFEAQRHLAEIAAAMDERLMDLAWSLRAQGVDAGACARIEAEAARLRLPESNPAPYEDKTPRPLLDAPAARAAAPPLRAEPLAVLDALPTREKLRFFA